MIYALTICFVYNLINAEHDAWHFKAHKKISHFWNAVIYCVVVAVVTLCLWKLGGQHWTMFISLVFLRPLVFDQWLNVRRGKNFNYQPQDPESVVDRIENKLFGRYAWALSNLCYLAVFVGGWILFHNLNN